MALLRRNTARILLVTAAVFAICAFAVQVDDTGSTKSNAEQKHDEQKHDGNEEESWTGWAKEKITVGLGIKNPVQTDEEEAGSKVGEGVKTAREKAQDWASGKYESMKEGVYSTGESTKDHAKYGKDKVSESGSYISDKAQDVAQPPPECWVPSKVYRGYCSSDYNCDNICKFLDGYERGGWCIGLFPPTCYCFKTDC